MALADDIARLRTFLNTLDEYVTDDASGNVAVPSIRNLREVEIPALLSDVEALATEAESDADRAEAARDVSLTAAAVYSDVPTGLAAVADDESFYVESSEPDVSVYVYKRLDASNAQFLFGLLTNERTAEIIAQGDSPYEGDLNDVVYALTDPSGNVFAYWDGQGALHTALGGDTGAAIAATRVDDPDVWAISDAAGHRPLAVDSKGWVRAALASRVSPVDTGAMGIPRRVDAGVGQNQLADLRAIYAQALAAAVPVQLPAGDIVVSGRLPGYRSAATLHAGPSTTMTGLLDAPVHQAQKRAKHYAPLQPKVQKFPIFDATAGAQYNHDATVEYFDGQWLVAWNQAPAEEGESGQINVIKRAGSPQELAGATAVQEWADGSASSNPVRTEPAIIEWQPLLRQVDDALWACWCQSPESGQDGSIAEPADGIIAAFATYFSVLTPGGQWANARFEFGSAGSGTITLNSDVANPPTGTDALVKLDRGSGTEYYLAFPVCGPYQDHAGRVMFPVALCEVDPADPDGWKGGELLSPAGAKLVALLYSDDGVNWSLSDTTQPPAGYQQDYQWENTVTQLADGTYLMLWRYPFVGTDNNHDVGSSLMEVRFSDPQSIGESTPSGIETTTSRAALFRVSGDRLAMVMQDRATGTGGFSFSGRRSLALFLGTENGALTPGNVLTPKADEEAFYPDVKMIDDQLAVAYSEGAGNRSIRLLIMGWQPDDAVRYAMPRVNAPQCQTAGGERSAAYVVGNTLTLKGFGSAGMETAAGDWAVRLRYRVLGASGSDLCIASVGDVYAWSEVWWTDTGYELREYAIDATQPYGDPAPTVTPLSGPSGEWRDLVIAYRAGRARVGGIQTQPVLSRLFVGRGVWVIDPGTVTAPDDLIEFDLTQCLFSEMPV